MLPHLFITVAYFQFENFPWPTSKSPALLQSFNFLVILKKKERSLRTNPPILCGFSGNFKKKGLQAKNRKFCVSSLPGTTMLMVSNISSTKYPIIQLALWPTTKCFYGPQVENDCYKGKGIAMTIIGYFSAVAIT